MPSKVNLQKWVTALRSGDYVQGVGQLNRDNKFCCLGVACEAAIIDGVSVVKGLSGSVLGGGVTTYSKGSYSLPESVMEWLGLGARNPIVGRTIALGVAIPVTASQANDDLRWSFDRIADELEVYYQLTEVG